MPWTPSYTQNQAIEAIEGATSWREALDALGVGYHGKTIATLRKWAGRWAIPIDHLTNRSGGSYTSRRYTEAEARAAISDSYSWAEALRKLGM